MLVNPFCFIPIHTTCDFPSCSPVLPSCFSVFIFYSSVFFFYFIYLRLTLFRRLVRFLLAFITVNRSSYGLRNLHGIFTLKSHDYYICNLELCFLYPPTPTFVFSIFSRSVVFVSLSCDRRIQDFSSCLFISDLLT